MAPSAGDVLAAGFREENVLVNAALAAIDAVNLRPYGIDEGFDPFARIKGTRYEEFAHVFVDAANEHDFEVIRRRLDRRLADRRILADAGWLGMGASALAGTADIINLVPIGGAAFRIWRGGSGVAKGFGAGATAAAGGAAASELGLHAFQPTRAAEESAFNISASAVFGGVLGGAIGWARDRFGRQAVDDLVDRAHAEMMGGGQQFGSASAALTRSVDPQDLRLLGERAVKLAAKVPFFRTPDLMMAVSDLNASRAAVQELAESHMFTHGAVRGRHAGPSIEARSRIHEGSLYRALIDADEVYRDYASSVPASERMGSREFYGAVGDSMIFEAGAKNLPVPDSAKPFIDRAQMAFRSRVYDPLGQQSLEVGLNKAEDFADTLTTAEMYRNRVYNRGKIAAERVKFRDEVLLPAFERLLVRERDLAREAGDATRQASEQLASLADVVIRELPGKARAIRLGRRLAEPKYIQELLHMLGRAALREADAPEDIIARVDALRAKAISPAFGARGSEGIRKGHALPPEELKELEEIALDWIGALPTAARDAASVALRAARAIARAAEAAEGELGDRLSAISRDVQAGVKKSLQQQAKARRTLNRLHFKDGRGTEAESFLDDIIDNILGDLTGRTGVDLTIAKRGPAKERVLRFIRDEELKGWVENDIRRLSEAYTRTLGPDVEIMRTYGDLRGQRAIDAIAEEARVKTNAAPAQAGKIRGQMESDIHHFTAMVERTRHLYGVPQTPQEVAFARAARLAIAWQASTKLANIVLSSFGDMGKIVYVHGLWPVVRDGIIPIIREPGLWTFSRRQAQAAGTAADLLGFSTAMRMADMADEWGPRTRIERGMDATARLALWAAGFDAYNQTLKNFSAILVHNQLWRNVKALAAGRKIPRFELARLARLGIDPELAGRMAAQREIRVGGMMWPDVDNWTAADQIRAWRSAVGQEIHEAVIHGGQDTPLFMSKPLGAMIMQFQRFGIASMQRTVISGAQRLSMGDMRVVSGMIAMLALGYIGYRAKAAIGGWETPEDPIEHVWKGFEQSGISAYFGALNRATEALTGGEFGVSAMLGNPQTKKYWRGAQPMALLGPTINSINDMGVVLGNIAAGEMDEKDRRRIVSNIPLANLARINDLLEALKGE